MSDANAWIFTSKQLSESKESDTYKDDELRYKTIWFMRDLSNVLRKPPPQQQQHQMDDHEYDMRDLRVFWTASVFFHRFYVYHNFTSHDRFTYAVACLFLASKVEEKPQRLSDHIHTTLMLRKREYRKKNDEYYAFEKEVVIAERVLLNSLNFDLNVMHPHNYFKEIVKDIKCWLSDPDAMKELHRLFTTLSSDSYRSKVCLLYSPKQIAWALVFLSLFCLGYQPSAPSNQSYRSSGNSMSMSMISAGGGSSMAHQHHHHQQQLQLQSNKGNSSGAMASSSSSDITWMEIFEKDIDEDVLRSICMQVLDVYTRSYNMVVPPLPFTGDRDELLQQIHSQFSPTAVTTDDASVRAAYDKDVKSNSAEDKFNYMAHNNTAIGIDEHKDSNSSRLIGDHPYHHPDDKRKGVYAPSSSSSSSWMRPPLPPSAFPPHPIIAEVNRSSYPLPVHHDDEEVAHDVDDDDDDDGHSHQHSHSSDEGDETPYDIPLPTSSDTPSTMGTCTPSFDDLALPTGNRSVHGATASLELGSTYYQCQLGKRSRGDEY